MKPRAIVVGYGYVGKAAAELLRNHYQVFIYDPLISAGIDPEKVITFLTEEELINKQAVKISK